MGVGKRGQRRRGYEGETVRYRENGRKKPDSMRQTDRQRLRQRKLKKDKERERERDRQTDRQRDRQTDRQRQRQRETETETERERKTTKESKSEKEMWRRARRDARSERVRIESWVRSKQNAEVITFYYDSFADKRKPRLTGDIISQKASCQKAEDKLKCQRPTSV